VDLPSLSRIDRGTLGCVVLRCLDDTTTWIWTSGSGARPSADPQITIAPRVKLIAGVACATSPTKSTTGLDRGALCKCGVEWVTSHSS
jgi:hypothetical protein